MKKKNKVKAVLVVIAFLFVIFLTSFFIKLPAVLNCGVISFSGKFYNAGNNLYISKDTPSTIKDSLKLIMEKADERVCNFWGPERRKGNPAVIFCYSDKLLKKYADNSKIVTYNTPVRSFVVFGKDRINLDMLSHELSHTEFCERIGYFNLTGKIPVWFNEGLAMQVDYRKEYSEPAYIKMLDSLKTFPRLEEIASLKNYYSGNFYIHYLMANHEVTGWMKKKGRNGLLNFIEQIKNGDDFKKAYY